MMRYKLSFFTMVCWMFVCKGAFSSYDGNYRKERHFSSLADEEKGMQPYNEDFEEVVKYSNANQYSQRTSERPVRKQTSKKYSDDPLIVETKNGRVRGVTLTSATGRLVDAWYGIPYAQKPLGQLRFRKPVPIERWDDHDADFVLNATTAPNTCVQVIDTMFGDFPGAMMWNPNSPLSEDCLYLNVITPHPRPRNAAVLMWIFGGGFYSGTSTLDVYDSKILASEENVIVVSVQYRVSSLGFLYFDIEDAPGNVGLFDQLMGLQWIHANIAAFGGNPDSITLFGESAGAVSVSLHLLSPLSRPFFRQAIMQSGAPTAPWAVLTKDESIRRGRMLAEVLKCPHRVTDFRIVVDCLRTVNASLLVEKEWVTYGVVDFPFVPVVDGEFLPCRPSDCVRDKQFKNTSILMGSNSEEGNYFILYHLTELFKKEENVFVSRKDFVKAVQDLNPDLSAVALQAVIFEYTEWSNPDDGVKNRNALDKIVGDRQFTCNVNELAHAYAESGNNVYMYFFTHRSSQNLWPSWAGVLHADEINFIFGEPLNASKNYRAEEKELSRRMMRYWANFARSGNPSLNTDNSWTLTFWPPHTVDGREYLTFDTNTSSTGKGPRIRPCVFWKQFLPRLLETADNMTRMCNNTANVPYARGFSSTHLVTVSCLAWYTSVWLHKFPFS